MAILAKPFLGGGAGNLTEIVFDGGLRAGLTDQARAVYDGNVASYRETVLTHSNRLRITSLHYGFSKAKLKFKMKP